MFETSINTDPSDTVSHPNSTVYISNLSHYIGQLQTSILHGTQNSSLIIVKDRSQHRNIYVSEIMNPVMAKQVVRIVTTVP